MIDGHVHLENGPLTVDYVMEFIESAMAHGIDDLYILDHTHRFAEFAPLYEGLIAASDYQAQWMKPKLKEPIENYYKLIRELRCRKLPIKVRFGLEVCYTEGKEDFLREILGQFDYDYLIGSVHSVHGLLYDMDAFSRKILWDKFPVDDIYRWYYDAVKNLIKSDLFTNVGHPDQIKIFGYEPTYDLADTYREIAALAKAHHIKVETNTGCHYRYHHPDIGTNEQFLQILKDAGVSLITSSDAHYPKDVGQFISEAAKRAGI